MSTPLTGLQATNYTGVQAKSPPNYVQFNYNPTIQSQNFFLGDIWLNKQTLEVWMLVRQRIVNGTPTGTWVKFAGAAGAITQITTNGGVIVMPNAGNVNIVGDGTSINITGNPGTNTATVSITGSVNHAVAVGNSTGTLNYIPVGATNQILSGNTGADPSWSTLTAGTGINIAIGGGTTTITNTGATSYSTGVWTPVLTFGGAATGIVYNYQVGIYTQIGNIVFVNATISLSSKGTATGIAVISGLPFTIRNMTTGQPFPDVSMNLGLGVTLSANYGAAWGQGITNTSTIQLDQGRLDGAAGAILQDTNFANAVVLTIEGALPI